jgi:hypothetical protein
MSKSGWFKTAPASSTTTTTTSPTKKQSTNNWSSIVSKTTKQPRRYPSSTDESNESNEYDSNNILTLHDNDDGFLTIENDLKPTTRSCTQTKNRSNFDSKVY